MCENLVHKNGLRYLIPSPNQVCLGDELRTVLWHGKAKATRTQLI